MTKTAEHRFYRVINHTTTDGIELYIRDYPADGPAVLCLHGLTRNSADFEVLVDQLPEHYRLLVPDQRGRGRSDYDPEPERYHLGTYVADMLSLLDALALDRVAIIGTSMGGLMGMLMHAAAPERIAGLVLNDIGPELGIEGIKAIADYVGRDMTAKDWPEAIAQTQKVQQINYPTFTQQQWETFVDPLYETVISDGSLRLAYDPAIAKNFVAAIDAGEALDLWQVFDLLNEKPLLLLRGVLSLVLTAETAQKMQQHIPQMQWLEVAERGHAPLLNEPDVVKAILTLLDDLYAES